MSNLNPTQIAILVVVLIISVVGHEIAHGYVAYKFGDNTAKNQNRLNINPLHHVDIIGTILVPAVLYMAGGVIFGWAKHVPVSMSVVLRNGGYKGAIMVSLAGICFNLLLALSAFLLLYTKISPWYMTEFLYLTLKLNIILAIFNLYPIPPLDGSHVFEYIARIFRFNNLANLYRSFDRYAIFILIAIIISPLGRYIFYPIGEILNFIGALLA